MSDPYIRETHCGRQFFDGDGWLVERDVCRHCLAQHEDDGTPFAFGHTRYSFGIYAGRYCDDCWPKSGYRDATDHDAKFDPLDAGEVLEPEDY